MDDIASQLAARDRFLQASNRLLTPRRRMEKMFRMQQAAWETLRRNPEGYARFLRRNFKARAVDFPRSQ
ncbi:MAG TPA: hypothetical protein VLJ39_00585 [Tepidisphaeraceae bacterium]|nr:hypothetical protein [Tepidisphaeraceae bacterium]